MNITIKDVAKLANVSPSTVSRALSNNSRISEKTRSIVMDAAKQLHYHPNIIARGLANSSTHILGLVVPNDEDELFKNPFFVQIMASISIYAQRKGYYMLYAFGKDDEHELSIIRNYVHTRLIDGIILLTSRKRDAVINYLKPKKIPFVVVGRPKNSTNVLWVDNDNFASAYNAVSHIIKTKSPKNIAFIGGPLYMTMSNDRFAGYKEALKDHGLKINEKLIMEEMNFSEESGYHAMNKILETGIPSALITTDDLLGIGAIKALKERNIFDIYVLGFNNTLLSEFQNPPLSSIDINAEKLGYYAAKLLIKKLCNPSMHADHYIVETKFIERSL